MKTNDPKREAILDAALNLIEEAGPHGWSMSQVSALAGISRGTVYNRFSTREALLGALLEEREVSFHERALGSPRERILDALVMLAKTRGLEATTLEAIAEHAQVGIATIYRNFDDRDGLIEAFAKERTPRAMLDELAISPGALDLREALVSLAIATLTFWQENHDMLAISNQPSLAENPLFEPFRQQELHGRRALADLIQAHDLDGAPELLAAQFIGLVHGPVMIPGLHDTSQPLDVEHLAESAVKLFLDGCSPSPTIPSDHTQESPR